MGVYLKQAFSPKGYKIKMREFEGENMAYYTVIYVFRDIGWKVGR
ncbi:hypothetical protein MtrunA17_Chr3g0129171 [Medicago truncatula]|uniref:Uncharacterized protein n=1 Tax=Medicago truncatula TaxID=3880 RepID=A0A396J0F5_MEDTR|nr:hypothetical protein MtrunA17_Chr3g0129171 [Medicago truncatula]